MEAAMATGAGPAGLTAAGPRGREGAAEATAAGGLPQSPAAAAFLSLPTPFEEEDEDDRHKCGRCQSEFTSLEEFVQHKLQKICQRPQDATAAATPVISPVEAAITVAHIVVEAAPITEEIGHVPEIVGSGQIKEVVVGEDHVFESPNGHSDEDGGITQNNPEGPGEGASLELIKVKLLVNKEGRYVCELCHKTFKTASILKAHMITHSSRKDYECKLCGTSFRTKGSLIRHHRRHTDERPYKCKKCGKSFRESGALTRHLKSLTPCTEKIRFNMNKEIVVSKEDVASGASNSSSEAIPSLAAPSVETSPVIHLVTDAKGNVLHEVHVQMQELPVSETKALGQESSNLEELSPDREDNENLLREAMRNSGIVIERVSIEEGAKSDENGIAGAAEDLKDKEVETSEKLCEEQYVEIEHLEAPDPEATHECKRHACPYCSETFKEQSSLDLHISGHLDYKSFTCEECGKEFTKGYLLKKHQEVHVNERRFRCGECGKLYKTIAHVKGHRRVHSDERPYPCPKCGKRYKTKNAQQVHFRTHLDEKPFVCQFCNQGFREKGSLVRHIRHHTGEKPFKCYKCGRGFAEHGTLNRHLRTKGGCLLALKEAEEAVGSEEGQSADRLAATVISEDPPTVLVEFSSVVADTQEYIIETAAEDLETSEAAEIIEGTRHEVDSHIMKVVQQIVNQANSGHQIIVQNVTVADDSTMTAEGVDPDTIAIATPESLTEQVAMTLASAIGEGAVLTTEGGGEVEEATVTMVASEDIEIMEHTGEFVIAAHEDDDDLEVQAVIV
ncbi:transcription factor E4F1 isoform X2 [Pseudonaja textilis]|uniref:Transcription factor E4F1 n=1 Tax=Pseudonaja textilis TaxID=8673 RepID=A0A670Y161_PSETE|nr:transcription factor E4F1 isoform X1 [Pseudonaja textilis]XP_026559871.1 transcription factor E4F1 isoform X1 [Pseudonaja textilis]XP_026559872.1 transcription factor E4F1 isoform X2 [Pseudonaja textilis]